MLLNQFLDTKPLFYDVIDLERMPNIFKKIKEHFKLPSIVHIVGTNGKGTTGRFLAQMLKANGLHVGHYTSPHILRFNERIWIDGCDVEDEILEAYHQKLFLLLAPSDREALSYFEYTTLLAMLIFCDCCDYVVLEAGLGGEFDATNIFEKTLSIVTPIGLDHQAFLGEHIEDIAQTKLNSINNDFILARQYAQEIYPLALQKSVDVKKKMICVEHFFDAVIQDKIDKFVAKSGYSAFLSDNFRTAFCALRHLGYDIRLDNLTFIPLQGRCQKIESNVTIDVGHNPMAARSIVKHFGEKKVVVVYNSFKDKDYAEILEILKPIVFEIQIIDIQNARIVEKEKLIAVANTLNLPVGTFSFVEPSKEYLVFGSFSVIEAFLKGRVER